MIFEKLIFFHILLNRYTIDTRYVTEEKYRVIYAGLVDASKFHCDKALMEFTKVMFMLTLKKGNCPGYVFVFDMKGMSLSHLSTLSINILRNYLYFVQVKIFLYLKNFNTCVDWYILCMNFLGGNTTEGQSLAHG